jgi:hypothetical protein
LNKTIALIHNRLATHNIEKGTGASNTSAKIRILLTNLLAVAEHDVGRLNLVCEVETE